MCISTGCNAIDTLLQGGIEPGIITEFYGSGGAGKTNLCLQLSKNVALGGKKVAFLDTEGVSMERLEQISGDKYEEVMKNILVFKAHSYQEQEDSIENIVDLVLNEEMDIGLVIVDSMTIFYRPMFKEERKKATSRLGHMLIELLKIARKEDIPVIITTQVYGSDEGVEPLGGHMMYHNAKTILKLEKKNTDIRTCTLVKHRSVASKNSTNFKITDEGLVSI